MKIEGLGGIFTLLSCVMMFLKYSFLYSLGSRRMLDISHSLYYRIIGSQYQFTTIPTPRSTTSTHKDGSLRTSTDFLEEGV